MNLYEVARHIVQRVGKRYYWGNIPLYKPHVTPTDNLLLVVSISFSIIRPNSPLDPIQSLLRI